jgi:hypothetical protein
MHLRILSLFAMTLTMRILALAPVPSEPPIFALVQSWAGSDAAAKGFTREQVVAFLNARKADLTAARQPQWSDWLKGLEQVKGPSLKAWALARRVEAGDYTAYPAFQEAITEHLLGISKPGSGRSDLVITDPPRGMSAPMPDALCIDHASVFWRSLRKTLQATPDRTLNTGLYSVWCFGTHPDQKDLILELAAQVRTPLTIKNPHADPWNDPRFWIVMDWAIAWGSRDDFEIIQKTLPEGAAQFAFKRVFLAMDQVPDFFKNMATAEPAKPFAFFPPPFASAPRDGKIPDPLQESAVEIPFSQIKVLDQPPAPRYPEEAKGRKMMTNLVLLLVVDPHGKPISARPLPGPWLGFFAPTGIAYGMRWRFRPAELNGVPLYSRFRLTMPFRLRN